MAVFADDYALVVGIDHYPGYRPLHGACRDARAFDAWLTDTDTGGGVLPAHRRLLLSTDDPVRPIQDEVDEALEELLALPGNGQARRFYLYFSGHGLAGKRMGTDLCLGKWSHARRNYALNSDDYYDMLVGTGKFSEIVCLLDCCRTRANNCRGMPSTLGYPRPDDAAGQNRRLIGYATEYLNSAYEAASAIDNQLDARGYFTHALLEALKGAAAVPGGGVPASKLKAYLESRTRELASRDNLKQDPEINNGFPANAEPLFGTALPDRVVKVNFSAPRHGHNIQVVDGNDSVIREEPADATGWELRLDDSLYMLIDLDDGDERSIRRGISNVDF